MELTRSVALFSLVLVCMSGCVGAQAPKLGRTVEEVVQVEEVAPGVTNTVRVVFPSDASCAVSNVSFNVRAGELRSITGGRHYARPTIAGLTKAGEGTLLVDSPVHVKGLCDVQAGTLKIGNLFSENGASEYEMLGPMPVFSCLRFASGARLDLSDNAGFLLQDLVGAPAVSNAGVFGISGKWTLSKPGEVLTVNGDGVTLYGETYAGQFGFADGSEFAFVDAAAEAEFEKAVTAAGSAGVVVAQARWVYAAGDMLGDESLVMPKPSATTSRRWSMRASDGNTTVRLFLLPNNGD